MSGSAYYSVSWVAAPTVEGLRAPTMFYAHHHLDHTDVWLTPIEFDGDAIRPTFPAERAN